MGDNMDVERLKAMLERRDEDYERLNRELEYASKPRSVLMDVPAEKRSDMVAALFAFETLHERAPGPFQRKYKKNFLCILASIVESTEDKDRHLQETEKVLRYFTHPDKTKDDADRRLRTTFNAFILENFKDLHRAIQLKVTYGRSTVLEFKETEGVVMWDFNQTPVAGTGAFAEYVPDGVPRHDACESSSKKSESKASTTKRRRVVAESESESESPSKPHVVKRRRVVVASSSSDSDSDSDSDSESDSDSDYTPPTSARRLVKRRRAYRTRQTKRRATAAEVIDLTSESEEDE